MIDRTNKNWSNSISDEEILNKEFNIAYLVHTNQYIELLQQVKDLVLSNYNVIAEFEYLGYNGDSIYCNGQKLVWRNDKFSNFSIGKNVSMLKHNLSTKGGGSNNYPRVSYEGAKCTLRFISYGLPYIDNVNGWSIKIQSIEKITE